MSKPMLNVYGRKHNVVGVIVEVDGKTETLLDTEVYGHAEVNAIDLNEAFGNLVEHQDCIEQLEEALDASVEYLTDLKLSLANKVLENYKVLPFADMEIKPIIEEIKAQSSFIEGIELSIEELKKVNGEVPSTE